MIMFTADEKNDTKLLTGLTPAELRSAETDLP
jgi:hypothetical protein